MPWRDAEGNVTAGTYQSWVDRQIAAAQERGEFDNLPGAGKPLTHLGNPDDPDWWVKQLIAREGLDISVALPPQLALRKLAQELPDRARELRSEQAVRDLVDDFNIRVRDSWRQPVEGPPVVARLVNPDDLVAHWRAHRPQRPPTPQPAGGPEFGPGGHAVRGRLRRAFGRLRLTRRRSS